MSNAKQNAEIIKVMDAKIAKLSVESAIDALKATVGRFDDGVDLVIERLMISLESRMDEAEYIALLESL